LDLDVQILIVVVETSLPRSRGRSSSLSRHLNVMPPIALSRLAVRRPPSRDV